jgi:hypothetical protein
MSDKVGNRRLSFMEDGLSMANSDKKMSLIAERRQSTMPRKSIYTRRLSNSVSHSSRKSSQDLTFTRLRFQNTYRTEPNENEIFQPYKVEPKLYALLEESLKDKKYDAQKSMSLSKELSENIMRELRLCMSNMSPRYKIVSHVLIGEMLGQDIRLASRCLWDTNFDNSASVIYKNGSLYAVATVYAVYFE